MSKRNKQRKAARRIERKEYEKKRSAMKKMYEEAYYKNMASLRSRIKKIDNIAFLEYGKDYITGMFTVRKTMCTFRWVKARNAFSLQASGHKYPWLFLKDTHGKLFHFLLQLCVFLKEARHHGL